MANEYEYMTYLGKGKSRDELKNKFGEEESDLFHDLYAKNHIDDYHGRVTPTLKGHKNLVVANNPNLTNAGSESWWFKS